MEKFLCIGGPRDGDYVSAPPDGRPWVKLAEKQVLPPVAVKGQDHLIESFEIKHSTYVLKEFYADGNRTAVWVPEGEDAWYALRTLMEKYKPTPRPSLVDIVMRLRRWCALGMIEPDSVSIRIKDKRNFYAMQAMARDELSPGQLYDGSAQHHRLEICGIVFQLASKAL